MKINEFIKEYAEATDKQQCIQNHITESYVSYATKVVKCQNIIDITSSKEVNGEKVYVVDSTARFMLYTLMLIESYTDIEIDYSQPVVCFDMLSENGIIAEFLVVIPQQEQKMFQMVLDMVRDDKYANERDLPSYIDNKITAMITVLGEMAKMQVESEKTEE